MMMGRHLREADVSAVIGLLESWDGDLGWESLRGACKHALSMTASRQTLARNRAITDAFHAAKRRLKEVDNNRTPMPSSLRMAGARIRRLESEVSQLREANRILMERFVKWQYNAYARGLLEQDLDRALPAIDRGRTLPVGRS